MKLIVYTLDTMQAGRLSKTKELVRDITSFIVPKTSSTSTHAVSSTLRVAAIVPTYRPIDITYKLINDLITSYKNMQVIVVDDFTPITDTDSMRIIRSIKTLAKTHKNVILIRTKSKRLKASALNFGLEYIEAQKATPDVVVTLDDDVVINKQTIPLLVDALAKDSGLGAVTSMAFVKNKKVNIITRLQGLEYHGFNITKLGDNGFLYGPLVMQGMLSAFRYDAITTVKGFAPANLIEDYDITVRVKIAGWKTAIVPHALAWTYVPETLGALWKQRIRWSYGGLIVLKDYSRHARAIFQDIIGHTIFLSLLILVLLSLHGTKHAATSPLLVAALVTVALLQFILAFSFNLLTLLTYRGRDRVDWFIKAVIIPEFAYSNMLSAILIGSYLFFAFNVITLTIAKYIPALIRIEKTGAKAFQKLGYSAAWGTKV